jgi:predicted NodU family carbamoyl transferase
MYIPKYYKVTNVDEIWDFVQKNSFGTIVTTDQGKTIATHLPLGLKKKNDAYYLTGHMAYGNPQWKTFETCENVLVMFFSLAVTLFQKFKDGYKNTPNFEIRIRMDPNATSGNPIRKAPERMAATPITPFSANFFSRTAMRTTLAAAIKK